MMFCSSGESDNSLTPSPCGTSPIALALAGAEKVCSSSSRKEKRSLILEALEAEALIFSISFFTFAMSESLRT